MCRQEMERAKAPTTSMMAKRTRVACALAAILAALGAQVLATAPLAAATGTTGFVIGEGKQGGERFGMIAWGAGPAAHGGFFFTPPGEPTRHVAKVTCLVVAGNDAIATGIVTEPTTAKGERTVMEAVDNGGASKDMLRFSFTPSIEADLTTDSGGRCWRPLMSPMGIETGTILVGTY